MRKINFQSEIAVAASTDDLTETDAMLLERAKLAAKDAYAPYSKFNVGAAVLLADGTVVIGNNQENAAFPVTLCGERNAIFAASAQYPNIPIVACAITVETEGKQIKTPVPPCGSCRQVIYETELRHKTPIRLILQGDSGDIYLVDTIKDILPLLFDSSYLER